MESALPARLSPDHLLGPKLWRAHEQAQIKAEPTGYAALDRVLPGGGWPIGAVSEILHAQIGVGEFSLSLPLLARLTQADRPVALISPPSIPYAPRLVSAGLQLQKILVVEPESEQDALWSAELLLRAGAGAVLLWIGKCDAQSLRRLQLAAETTDSCALLLRPDPFAAESTPSALRLRVWRENGAPCVEVLKCRGAKPAPVTLRNAA
ncbi:MAG: translesion DNA synthesis-associated protein ImuA [Panacagrimonas sp.]